MHVIFISGIERGLRNASLGEPGQAGRWLGIGLPVLMAAISEQRKG